MKSRSLDKIMNAGMKNVLWDPECGIFLSIVLIINQLPKPSKIMSELFLLL